MKTRQEILKSKYGFDKGSYDYVPKGCEIHKYIGQRVVYVDYKKKEDGTWDTDYKPAILLSLSDFDPINMTYLAKYKIIGEDEIKEFRMIPEGYCWVDSKDADYVQRFLPTSMHCKLVEDELFYERLKELWNRDTLPIDSLMGLSSSKDKTASLRYSHHLACLIKLEGEEDILYFRIQELNLIHRSGKQYALSIKDGEGNPVKMLITSEMKDYEFENGIGRFKIIDLC